MNLKHTKYQKEKTTKIPQKITNQGKITHH